MTGLRQAKPDGEVTMHGTCVAIGGRGVLILGAPGSGKSDLALRLIDRRGRGTASSELVADDQVTIGRQGNRLTARAPVGLYGKLEIRGLGIASVKARRKAILKMAVILTGHKEIERMPDTAEAVDVLGVKLRAVRIDPASASAPARVRAALDFRAAS